MNASTPSTDHGADYDVIVVGAGPTGAALAGDLGRRGKRVLLVERTDGVVEEARLHTVNIRTMELARNWGIEQELRDCGWPLDHPQDVVWGTSLSDPEIARIPWPAITDMTPPSVSPTFAQRCPQKWFNPILLGFARRQPTVTTLLEWQVDSVDQDADTVTATVSSTTSGANESHTYSARYLVAADGARSNIRRDLGIDTVKSSVWGTSAEVIISSPDLKSIPLAQTLGRFTLVEPTGMAISLLPFDGRDQYRITWMVGDGEITHDHMVDAARRIAGREVELEFRQPILPWTNRETTATAFRRGRVFLAGDAAHTIPTTGGFGMNVGVQDSFDLAWKLDAALTGWAGDALLDTYDLERRAVVTRTAELASSIYRDWVRTRDNHRQFWERIDAGGDIDAAKAELGDHIVTTFAREFNNIPGALGYHYTGSPVIVDDSADPFEDDVSEYTPSARPGHRAPHVWLSPAVSTLDVFGPGFTLLVLGNDAPAPDALTAAAARVGVPVHIVAVTDPAVATEALAAYERRLVLVRPDGHVAWRDDHVPDDPSALVETVRGAATSEHHRPCTADATASARR